MFPIIPCGIRMLLLNTVYKYDTPHYYLMIDDIDSAKNVIEKIYVDEETADVLLDCEEEIKRRKR